MNPFQRLDAHLADLALISRSQAQKWIQDGFVKLNGLSVLKTGTKVKEGDSVTWEIPLPAPKVVDETLPPLQIVFENEKILVIDKEPFWKVHPSASAPQENTLIDRVEAHLGPSWFKAMKTPLRPGIIHRLDKDTSGILLIAKTPEAHAHYASFFEKRLVFKEYYALVKGHPRHPQAKIEAAMRRHAKDRLRMTLHPQGKEAISEYEVVETFQDVSLLKVSIKTGRMHQIRVHMASIGHPVLGDGIYGDKSLNKKFASEHGLNRQFLHAFHLKLDDLDISIPLEKDLEFVLKKLKKAS